MQALKEKLLSLLIENARYDYTQLAYMAGADQKDVELAVKELEKDGVIVKYATIIDAEKLAKRKVQAFIEVKVAPQKLRGFDSYAEEIYSFSEVKSLYLMSGSFDLAVFVEGDSLADIAKFISEKLSIIEGITSVQTSFILKKYKVEGQVTKPSKDNDRQIIQAWEIL